MLLSTAHDFQVTVKERRRFQDINDEEIDDERRTQKLRGPGMSASSATSTIPRRIRLEVGSGMGDLKREAEVYREQKWEGQVSWGVGNFGCFQFTASLGDCSFLTYYSSPLSLKNYEEEEEEDEYGEFNYIF